MAEDMHDLMRCVPFLLRPVLRFRFLTPRARAAFPTEESLNGLLLLVQDLADIYWSHHEQVVRTSSLKAVGFFPIFVAFFHFFVM